jgi:hypothetical protein
VSEIKISRNVQTQKAIHFQAWPNTIKGTVYLKSNERIVYASMERVMTPAEARAFAAAIIAVADAVEREGRG